MIRSKSKAGIGLQTSLINKTKRICFLAGKCRAFTFSKNIQKGQYVLPFSFKLPENLPGSMNVAFNSSKEGEMQQQASIRYSVEVYVDGLK